MFIKALSNFFTVWVFYYICQWYCLFDFFNNKNVCWPILLLKNVSKTFLYFAILTESITLNLGSLSLFSTSKSVYVFDVTSIWFILIVLWYVLLYLLTISFNLSIYTFFDIAEIYYTLFFKVLTNLLATIDFHSSCVE